MPSFRSHAGWYIAYIQENGNQARWQEQPNEPGKMRKYKEISDMHMHVRWQTSESSDSKTITS